VGGKIFFTRLSYAGTNFRDKVFQVYERREENISFYEPLYMLSKYTIFSWLKYLE